MEQQMYVTDPMFMCEVRGRVMRAIRSIVSSELVRRWPHDRCVHLVDKDIQALRQ
jgi:hypothetical protein